MGEVEYLGQPCMLKIVSHPKEDEKSTRQEAVFMETLHHPHVLRLLKVEYTKEKTYLCTPKCEGDSFDLATTLNAIAVMTGIREALVFLHQNQIYHRDITPENFLVTQGGTHGFLTDFGIATKHKQTPLYWFRNHARQNMHPPEVFLLETKQVNNELYDTWAFGICFWYLLHNRRLPWKYASPDDPGFTRFQKNPIQFLRQYGKTGWRLFFKRLFHDRLPLSQIPFCLSKEEEK